MRALLALLVLLGMLPVQVGIGASAGRADSGTTVLYLDNIGGVQHLSVSEPPSNGSVVLGRNMTVNFTMAGFSGLYASGPDWFVLDLSLVSLNFSGMELDCRLHLDYYGNASNITTLAFQKYTTAMALQTEHALIHPEPVDHEVFDVGLRNGSLRLELARVDGSDGLLEVLCGSGENESTLSIPYGAPLRADAGPDRSTQTNRTIGLNASLSGSVDPAATEHLWNFGNGMTGAGEQVTAVYDRPGTYNVTLTLRWNGLESTDTVVVSVADNRPPVADAGLNLTKRAGENITFRGSGSDPDGYIVSYNWSFGDGFWAPGQNVTHSYVSPGNYSVMLTVVDDGGAEGQDGLGVHVNHPPRITNLTAVRNGAFWNFQVVALDPDGTLPRYNWSFGDGSQSTLAQPSHSYSATGTYTVQCRVTDEYGDSAAATVNVTVTNAPPRINNLSIASTSTAVNEPVRFTTAVSDPDGDALTFLWDFGDGTTSHDQNPTHYYTEAGTYTVTLRVSDGISQDTRTDVVKVSEYSGAGLDSGTLSFIVCITIILVLVFIGIAKAAADNRKRQEQAGQYGGGQYQQYGGLPSAPQPYGGGFSPTYGTPQYQPYGGQYPAAPAPPRAASRPPKAPPGVCPRCGSTDQQRFPDGHAKCNSCKKIFFTG